MKTNIIKSINILVFLIIFAITFVYLQTQYISGHDFFTPYLEIFKPRIIPSILNKLYNAGLPNLFNMHPLDFRTNYIVCSLVSLFYISIVLFLSKGFYLFSENKNKYFDKKESILLLPLCFLLVSVPVNIFYDALSFLGISETSVFFEHSAGFILYFPFLLVIFNIIFNGKQLSKKGLVIYSIIGFLLGFWSEFINLPAFFTLVFVYIFLFLFQKEKLKNWNLNFLFFSFILGLIIYYFGNGFFSLTRVGTISEYNIIERLPENIKNIGVFTKCYFERLFIPSKYFWLIFLSVFIVFLYKVLKNKDRNILLIIIPLSPVIGFLTTAYSAIFIQNYRLGQNAYVFQYDFYTCMEYPVILFSVLIMLGILYFLYENKVIQTAIIMLFLAVISVMAVKNTDDYKIILNERTKYKDILYNVEQKIVVNSVFGESTIFHPQIYNNQIWNNISNDNSFLYTSENDYIPYRLYFNNHYKHKLKGFIITNLNETAKRQYNEKFQILGKQKKQYNLFSQIKFQPLRELDNIELTLDKINELEQEYRNYNFLKLKAYIYYQSGNYISALDLYKKYLKIIPDDFDALMQISKIYQQQENYKKELYYLSQLHSLEPDNKFFIYSLAKCYYNQGEYEKALEQMKLMEPKEESPLNKNIYYNFAIIYKELKQENEAKKYFDLLQLSYENNFYTFYNGKEKLEFREYF